MNWLKLLRYDLRNGLLRWRYLCVPLLFAVSCYQSWIYFFNAGCTGTWMDYLMGCFRGAMPAASVSELEFPMGWFLIMAGCLFLNLDYPMNDLTDAGQQVIVRLVNKKGWFLSKCAWNLLSSVVYMLLGMGTALVFALLSGGTASLRSTPQALIGMGIYGNVELSVAQGLVAAVLLPTLTIAALNMLQMALTLIIKPIFGFLICVCTLVLALLTASPFVLGNGAMTARNGVISAELMNPLTVAIVCGAIIILSGVVGMLRFCRMDHLRYEE